VQRAETGRPRGAARGRCCHVDFVELRQRGALVELDVVRGAASGRRSDHQQRGARYDAAEERSSEHGCAVPGEGL